MKIVVDTNIVFSALLNPDGKINELILNSQDIFEFYSPSYILEELENHKSKLRKISGFSTSELNFLFRNLFKKIDLIDLESIRESTWNNALALTQSVDEFDTPFIALALELDCPLWSGDKKLKNGLGKKGVDWILNTEIIVKIRSGKE